MKKNKISVIHFHPEMKCNKGDIAITLSIEDLLKENIDIYRYTHCLIKQLKEREYPVLIDDTSKGPLGSKIVPMVSPLKKVYRKIRKVEIRRIVKKINNHDLVIIGGGGIYSNSFFPLDKKILTYIKKPLVIFSPGANINLNHPKLTKKVKKSIKLLNGMAKLSSVRDQETLKILKNELDKDTPNIGCPSILLSEEKSKKLKIDRNKFNLGINIGFHVSSINKKKVDEIIETYGYVINNLSLKKPIKIYYFKHHPKEKYVIKRLNKLFRDITVVNLSPKKMKYYYGKMDFVLCMMLHSSILAFGSETNFFNFSYNLKNIAFMKDIGKEKDYVKISGINDKKKIYHKVCNSIKRNNKGKKDFFEKEIKKFIEKIRRLVNK